MNTAHTFTTCEVACCRPMTRDRASPLNVAAVSASAAVLKNTPPTPRANRLRAMPSALERNQPKVPNRP